MLTRATLLLALSVISVHAYPQSTTYADAIANNTSACDKTAGSGGPAHCQAVAEPSTDNQTIAAGSSILTKRLVPVPRSINKGRGTSGDIHTLLYSGATTKVFFHLQPWFCAPGTGTYTRDGATYKSACSHIVSGYTSDDSSSLTVTAQMDDMYDRGADGVVPNWYGGSDTCWNGGSLTLSNFSANCTGNVPGEDDTVLKVRNRLDSNYSGSMQFSIDVDEGSFNSGQNCDTVDADQPKCVQLKLEADFQYMQTNYFTHSSYLKVSGHPVVSFFIDELDPKNNFAQCSTGSPCNLVVGQCTSGASCWNEVWNGLRSWTTSNVSPTPYFVFRNGGGFTHNQSDGGFGWVNPRGEEGTAITNASQLDWEDNSYLPNYYSTAATHTTMVVFGIAKKGFDDENREWATANSTGKVTAQKCGQVWLASWAEPGSHGFGTSKQLQFMQVGTWNDYDEGTEVETGIDNCLSDLSGSMTGTVLHWVPQWSDTTYGTDTTIDHYVVYDSSDGQNLTVINDDVPTGTDPHLDVATLGSGVHKLLVMAVGKPSIMNRMMSTPVTYTVSGSRTVTITAPASNSTVDTGPVTVTAIASSPNPIASMQIYLNSVLVYEMPGTNVTSINTTIDAPCGLNHITVKAWDSGGAFSSAETFTVNRAAIVTAPADGATVGSPVTVTATACTNATLTATQIYIDNVIQAQSSTGSVSYSWTPSTGSHTIVGKGWDSRTSGNTFLSKTVHVTH